jgi:hypothetical protein
MTRQRRSIPALRPVLALAVGVALLPAAARAADAPKFQWVEDAAAGTFDLRYGDAPVLRYMATSDKSTPERAHETFKVYHHVFGPGTGRIVTKGPGGKYTHHRGLYVGWNKTSAGGQTYDFWHCNKGERLEHQKILARTEEAGVGGMTSLIHWNDPQGQPVIVETRTVTVKPLALGAAVGKVDAWQIDWKTELQSRRGEIDLAGDRQHAGFQYRADQPVADANNATYIRPAAFPQQGKAIEVGDAGTPPAHIDLGWFAMTYELDGQRYTAEYFQDPALPKPSLYSERPYGRFGAFFRATLTPEKPLTMKYRVIVSTGPAPDRDAIQKRYDAFVAELKSQP